MFLSVNLKSFLFIRKLRMKERQTNPKLQSKTFNVPSWKLIERLENRSIWTLETIINYLGLYSSYRTAVQQLERAGLSKCSWDPPGESTCWAVKYVSVTFESSKSCSFCSLIRSESKERATTTKARKAPKCLEFKQHTCN